MLGYPRKLEQPWPIDGEILARMPVHVAHANHIDAKLAADSRVDLDVNALHVAGFHELHETHGIRPRIEHFLATRVHLLSHNERSRLHLIHRCSASRY